VLQAFISAPEPGSGSAATRACFAPSPGRPGHYLADLYALARLRLAARGVTRVFGGGLCTYSDAARFYSYRRDGDTGRMASLILIKNAA
jgi:copper oxidase (laccase) domain-containing protein